MIARAHTGVRTFPLGPTPLDGIALYPDTTRLYYCPLNGLSLYSLPTSVLRNFSLSNNQVPHNVLLREHCLMMIDSR